MRRFIKQLSYFLITCIIASVIANAILPNKKYWGNPEYESKIENFKKQEYNVVFFGSSRILTGLNPISVDSLTKEKLNIHTKSYNLATPGTWSNETFYLYEQFIEDKSLSERVNFVFMEFQNIMAIKFEKISSPKVTYYQTINNLKFIGRFAKEEVKLDVKKIPFSLYITGLYSLAWLEEQLNFGKSKLFFGQTKNSTASDFDSRGFQRLDYVGSGNSVNGALNEYVKSIQPSLFKSTSEPNRAFYNKVMELIQKSEAKGIKLIFILPPVKVTQSMMAVYHALPGENKIQICDPAKFKELFKPENWADEVHLNINGSKFLNEYFIQEISRLKGL